MKRKGEHQHRRWFWLVRHRYGPRWFETDERVYRREMRMMSRWRAL